MFHILFTFFPFVSYIFFFKKILKFLKEILKIKQFAYTFDFNLIYHSKSAWSIW